MLDQLIAAEKAEDVAIVHASADLVPLVARRADAAAAKGRRPLLSRQHAAPWIS